MISIPALGMNWSYRTGGRSSGGPRPGLTYGRFSPIWASAGAGRCRWMTAHPNSVDRAALDDTLLGTGAEPTSRRTRSPTAEYRPHLDGLRAVAVYLVVLFHAGSDRFSGGYIGVDVFFVLSGFLVTQLLLRDIDRERSIRFGASTRAGSGGCCRPRSSR